MPNWDQIRASIPAAKNSTYLMSAAAGPLHPLAFQRLDSFNREMAEFGVSKNFDFEGEMIRVRALVAEFLHSKPEEIAFVNSSSMAMNFFAMFLKKIIRDSTGRVLTMADEFPSSTLPWLYQGFLVDFVPAEAGVFSEASIRLALTNNTKILVSSHTQFCTGFRQSLDILSEIAREKKLVSILNATQSLGAFNVDGSQVDFVCASIHKWLMSGFGLSIVKVGQRFLKEPLPVHGWLSEVEPWKLQNRSLHPVREARGLETGAAAIPQILAVGEVLQWTKDLGGVGIISDRILELVSMTKAKLKANDIPLAYDFSSVHSSGILIVKCQDGKAVAEALAKRGVFVSPRGAGIRLALHYFNNEDDVNHFVEEFKNLSIQ